ncbi:hypothetical protein TNCV_4884771 [Trichonephila clavipes]|nr:hypothetical protein TNCV_4884771 [Trichonephila clavipes]
MRRRINQKVFRHVSKPHRAVHSLRKASRTGNCKRLNSNGISVGIIRIRGNRTSSPLNFPVKIVASITLFIIFLTESLVPLQSRGGFMFRRSMMGTPIFNVIECAVACLANQANSEFSWIVDNRLILILHSIDGLICCRFTGYSGLR